MTYIDLHYLIYHRNTLVKGSSVKGHIYSLFRNIPLTGRGDLWYNRMDDYLGGSIMKRYLRIAAAALACSMLAVSMPINAAYESKEEIALSLRGLYGGEGVYIREGEPDVIYVSPEAAANGTSVHFGLYIETEKPDLICMEMRLEPDVPDITFVEETFVSPTTALEEATYELPDGRTYTSKYAPYCFGYLNPANVYTLEAFWLSCNFKSSENALISTWQHGTDNISSFLGGASDTYSYIQFDAAIAAGITPGEHSISFIADEDAANISDSPTYVSSDSSMLEGAKPYTDMIPTLKNARIIVEGQPVKASETVYRFAEDETPLNPADFEGSAQVSASEAVPFDGMTFYDVLSPAEMGIEESVFVSLPLLNDGYPVLTSDFEPIVVEYAIGKRGDADGNGTVDALDAAMILSYAAQKGVGEASLTNGSEEEEAFALFRANVTEDVFDGEPQLDAADAAYILTYAALAGSGEIPDWNEIIGNN